MMQEAANLSFVIDSSQAVAATQALEKLVAQAGASSRGAKELSVQAVEAQRAMAQLAQAAALTDSSLRQAGGGVDTLVMRVQALSREVGLFRSSSEDLRRALGNLGAAGELFNTTAAGLDAFARSSRNVGQTNTEMVQGLQRISMALEGITLAGQRARQVLQDYGVRVEGRGVGDEAAILREFVEARRRFDPASRRPQDDFAVLGPQSLETLTALQTPRYRTIEQRQREVDAGAASRRALEQQAETARRDLETERRRAEREDLAAEYFTFGDRFRPGIFGTSASELRALRESGLAPRSEAFTTEFDAQGRPRFRGDPRANPFGENGDLGNTLAFVPRWIGAELGWQTSPEAEENRREIRSRLASEWETALNDGQGVQGLAAAVARYLDRLTENTLRNYVPVSPAERPPTLYRTPSFNNQTEVMLNQAAMRPQDRSLQGFLISAAQQFGNIDTSGWERLDPEQLLLRFPDVASPNDPRGLSPRASMLARIRANDEVRALEEDFGRQDRGLLRRAATTGLTAEDRRFGDLTFSYDDLGLSEERDAGGTARERAQQIAQAILRVRAAFKTEEERARELLKIVDELDQDRQAGSDIRVSDMRRGLALQARIAPMLVDADPRNSLANTFNVTRERALADGLPEVEANTRALMALTEATLSLERTTNQILQQATDQLGIARSRLNYMGGGALPDFGSFGMPTAAGAQAAGRVAAGAAAAGLPDIRAVVPGVQPMSAPGASVVAPAGMRYGGPAASLPDRRGDPDYDPMLGSRQRLGLQPGGAQEGSFRANPGLDGVFVGSPAPSGRLTPLAPGRGSSRGDAGMSGGDDLGDVAPGRGQGGETYDPSGAVVRRYDRAMRRPIVWPPAPYGDPAALDGWNLPLPPGATPNVDPVTRQRAPLEVPPRAAPPAPTGRSMARYDGSAGMEGIGPYDPGRFAGDLEGQRNDLAARRLGFNIWAGVARDVQRGFVDPSRANEVLGLRREAAGTDALAELRDSIDRTTLAFEDSRRVIGARNEAERELQQVLNQTRNQNAERRAALNLLPEGDRARREGLALLDGEEARVRRQVFDGQIDRFDAGMRRQREDLTDARTLSGDWWRSPESQRTQADVLGARRRAERSLAEGVDDETRALRVDQAEQIAREIAALRSMQRELGQVRDGFADIGQAAVAAFDQIVIRGGDARQVISSLLMQLGSSLFNRATRGFGDWFAETALGWMGSVLPGGGAGTTPLAQGGVIRPMAQGEIVHSPLYKPMANGDVAMMGEAGSEAVLPLKRDANGNLGVVAAGGEKAGHTINITVNGGGNGGGGVDQEQAKAIADAVSRALDERSHQTLLEQQRVGGMLNPLFSGVR